MRWCNRNRVRYNLPRGTDAFVCSSGDHEGGHLLELRDGTQRVFNVTHHRAWCTTVSGRQGTEMHPFG